MISLLCALLISAPQSSAPTKLEGKPGFEEKISITANLKSVDSVLRLFALKSPESLSVDPKISELKLTLRIQDRSRGWVLDCMADVLDLEWRPTEGGFRLVQPAVFLVADLDG